ncbi:MFS general substrate transporter [Tricholoma matsutake]|nr:MFS general substrate transporter [Tricholoma matsutake 945]
MVDIHDKEAGYHNGSSDTESSSQHQAIFERPTGLKGVYYHPITQVSMLGLVCFTCPGLFNALNGLGGGGQVDNTTSANSNAALYATFAASAFFAGPINNKLGSRLTLLLGTGGYALYIGSYLALNIHSNAKGFVIAAGAILGICAGFLWTAQGSLMLAYPTEGQKGRFVGIFWTFFNLGGIVGASLTLGQNFHSTIVFLCLTCIGVSLPMLMADPGGMIRTDGTKVATPRHSSWKVEILGLYYALRQDPLIILLFPMFFASNWFYTWEFNDYNGTLFNIRARALNNLVYWISQIFGSLVIGFLLDKKNLARRVRAFAGWSLLFILVFLVHIWAYFYQKTYTRASVPPAAQKMDIFDSGYTSKIFLYVFCGILDAMWQTTSYWLIGAMSNDPAKLAHFAGFYKSLQSAGSAGVWRADAVKLPFMNIFISVWILLVVGLVAALPMIHLRVKEHTDIEDETLVRMDEHENMQPVKE